MNPFSDFNCDCLFCVQKEQNPAKRIPMIKRCLGKMVKDENEIIVMWTSSIRMTASSLGIEGSFRRHRLLAELFDNGFVEVLIKLITHGYTDVMPAEVPRLEGIESESADDPSFYPTYAAEILLYMMYNVTLQNDEARFVKTIRELNLVEVLLRAMRYGLTVLKYFACNLLGALIIKLPKVTVEVGTGSWQDDAELSKRIVSHLLEVLKLPLDTYAKEIDSERGGHTVDIVKRMQSPHVAKAYSPRYITMLKENASGALQSFVASNLRARQKQLLLIPGIVDGLLDGLKDLPHESYPDANDKSRQSSTLAALFDVDPSKKDREELKELFLFADQNAQDMTGKLINSFKLLRETPYYDEWAFRITKRTPKYYPDSPITQETIGEVSANMSISEIALLDALSEISIVESIAARLAKSKWLIDELFAILEIKGKNKHDTFLKMVLEVKDGWHGVDLCYNPMDCASVANKFYRVNHFTPTYYGSALILLRNLMASAEANPGHVEKYNQSTSILNKWKLKIGEYMKVMAAQEKKPNISKEYRLLGLMAIGEDPTDEKVNSIKKQLQPQTQQPQKKNESEKKCNFCGGKNEKLLRCSACRNVVYCNATCQKNDWKTHKQVCKKQ